MSTNKFQGIDFNCIQFRMAWKVEVFTNGLCEVRFGNIAEMLYKSFLQLSLGLAYIEELAMCALEAVNKVTAMASEVLATF